MTIKEEDIDLQSDDDDANTLSAESTEKFQRTLAVFAFASGQPRKNSERPATSSSMDAVVIAGSSRKRQDTNEVRDDQQRSPKKQRRKRGYADPEVYKHLNGLDDILRDGLDVIFCGINPGQKSAEVGHHFANPTNHFWHCLFESGLTSYRLTPYTENELPDFGIGLTDLVERPTAEQGELSLQEQEAGVPSLLVKIAMYRPLVVCFVGQGIAKIVHSKVTVKGRKTSSQLGLQPYKMVHHDSHTSPRETLFFAVSSTSARVVSVQKSGKVEQFKNLKVVVDEVKQSKIDTSDLLII